MNEFINILILSGIPGSGKTYWSYNYIKNNSNIKRINRDDLRKMLDNNKFSKNNENFIKKLKMELIKFCLINDKNIILDDTHCNYDKLKDLIDYIKIISEKIDKKIKIIIVNFDIDINTAYDRNINRENKLKYDIVKYMFDEKIKIDYNKLSVDNIIKIID